MVENTKAPGRFADQLTRRELTNTFAPDANAVIRQPARTVYDAARGLAGFVRAGGTCR